MKRTIYFNLRYYVFDGLRHYKTKRWAGFPFKKMIGRWIQQPKKRCGDFFFKKKFVFSEKRMRAVHRTRNQIGVA